MRSLSALALAALTAGACTGSALAQTCDLTTTFNSGQGLQAPGTMVFNLTVNTPIVITGFEVNTNAPLGTPLPLSVWTTPNAYNGQLLNPGVWTQVGQDNGTGSAAGVNTPSPIPLQNPIILFAGSYGMALHAPTWTQRITVGNATNQSYSNACFSFQAGAGSTGLFAGNIVTPRVWNGTIRAQRAAGLYADFTAGTTSGTTPLTVSFSDASYTTSPTGVTGWAWDFDGDSIIDSNAQNPSFTYTTCGRYDVTLTANDNINAPSTIRKRAFVAADPQLLIDADFTFAAGPTPLSMAFTDASSGNPTLWSWDFDGDNVPDSASQNPTWTYSAPGTYTVTLGATNTCGSDTERKAVTVIVNDDCSGAISISAGLSPTYSNTNSTTSFPWPCAAGGSDVWFVYRAPCAGSVILNTCTGTTYDSALEAFSGPCSQLVSIACNDDSCGLASSITFPVLGNQSYYIRVGGYNGGQGNFNLNLTFNPTGQGSWATVFPACAGATLTPTGTPTLGTQFDLNVSPATGPTFITIGSVQIGFPLCPQGCILGHNMDVVLPGPTFSTTVPCLNFLRGGSVFFQGIVLGAPGGCTSPAPLATTDRKSVV